VSTSGEWHGRARSKIAKCTATNLCDESLLLGIVLNVVDLQWRCIATQHFGLAEWLRTNKRHAQRDS
jgi:hypothetical protein